jgi:hypothetical protein
MPLPSPSRLTLLAFLLPLLFYLYTLQPSLAWGDGAKLQSEAITGASFVLWDLPQSSLAADPFPFARLGVAAWDHPLYVMLGYLLVRLVPTADPLWLVNLISAVFGAGAIALLFHLGYTQTNSAPAALLAASWLAVSHTFWFHAATPEVYTLFAFLLLLCLTLFSHYEKSGRWQPLAGSALALGLAASDHMLAFLAFPALLLYWLFTGGLRRWTGLFRPPALRAAALAAGCFLLGFAPWLIQFLRLSRSFAFAEIMGPVVGSTFLGNIAGFILQTIGLSLATFLLFLFVQFTPVGVAAGVYGFWQGGRVRPAFRRKVTAGFIVYAAFGVFYQVTDQFAFFLTSYIFFALALALGLARLLEGAAPRRARALTGLCALTILGTPFLYQQLPGFLRAAGVTEAAFEVPQIGTGLRDGLAYYINPNKHGDDAPYRFGRETVTALPAGAVVIAEWYADTDEFFILNYFAQIEQLRPDVTVHGWARVEPWNFDPQLAADVIEASLAADRPVFLASLSEEFYAAPTLAAQYCITVEASLYRLHPEPPSAGCLAID